MRHGSATHVRALLFQDRVSSAIFLYGCREKDLVVKSEGCNGFRFGPLSLGLKGV